MLKVKLSGTKKELRWFLKKIQRDCRWQVRNISNFSSIERTNGKYKRLYVDVYRKDVDVKKGIIHHEEVRDWE